MNQFGKRKGLDFFRIPSTQMERGRKWVVAMKRKAWQLNEHLRICGDHFISGMVTAMIAEFF